MIRRAIDSEGGFSLGVDRLFHRDPGPSLEAFRASASERGLEAEATVGRRRAPAVAPHAADPRMEMIDAGTPKPNLRRNGAVGPGQAVRNGPRVIRGKPGVAHELGVEGDHDGRSLRRGGGRGRRPHRDLLGTATHRGLHAEQSGQPVDVTLQTVGAFGSGSHPTWVSYLTVAPGPMGPHHALPGARTHPDQRDDLQLRLREPAAQPAARPGHRDDRQRGHPERQALPGHRLEHRQRGRPHLLDPVARDQRAALRQRPQRQPLRGGAVHRPAHRTR